MLRIPTRNLSSDKLVTRSQQVLFTANDKALDAYIALRRKTNPDAKAVLEECSKIISHSKADVQMLLGETPAYMSKHYTQKKHALEYIYKDDIPSAFLEKIGEVNIAKLRKTAEYNPVKPIQSIFKALLNETPECKAAELLNC